MKIAVQMKETFTRTVIVEAEDYLEAEDIVSDAYNAGRVVLHADNSSVDLELENDTENYIGLFGQTWFDEADISEEFQQKGLKR